MKKLYINGRFLAQRITGVQRYGRELLKELDLLLENSHFPIEVEILVPRNASELPRYKCLTIRKVGFLTGHSWEQFELPFYSWGHLLFTPCAAAPLLHAKNVVWIPDAAIFAAPMGYTFPYRIWYKILGLVLCRTALQVLTLSKFSKAELVRWCRARPEKIVVTYAGSEHAQALLPDALVLQKHGLVKRKYILAVSSKNPNKNFAGLISALPYVQDMGFEFAIAGNTDDRVFRRSVAELTGIKDLGYVTDSELRALYENAACFVFPSFYEGFGLPPLEALSLGCPVVVANTASMPELFEGMATFCRPDDPKDIADKIIEVLRSPSNPDERARISRMASRFSWKNCARQTWSVLQAHLPE